METLGEVVLQGIPICSGIAIGTAYSLSVDHKISEPLPINDCDLEEEIKLFFKALHSTREELLSMIHALREKDSQEAADVLEVQTFFLKDPRLTEEIPESIRSRKVNSEYLLEELARDFKQESDKLEHQLLREKSQDIFDLVKRIKKYLSAQEDRFPLPFPKGSIIFAQDLTPADTAEIDESFVSAFVTNSGGVTSHTSIVAKAKGIPYVTRIDLELLNKLRGVEVIVDGKEGRVILNPSKKTLKIYKDKEQKEASSQKNSDKLLMNKTETLDGSILELRANLECLKDIQKFKDWGGCSVGLFRSEYLLNKIDYQFPDEEEQYQVYLELSQRIFPNFVTIRFFDIGGDKFNNKLDGLEKEANPFLGCRAIRYLLHRKSVFRSQIRAILRASGKCNIRLLLPMISCVNELRKSKKLINEVKQELLLENKTFDNSIKIGCMIEVPSAALISDLLAKECDFLSIGTNDLTQYTLAVDRSNQHLTHLYEPYHPSIIRLLRMVIKEAKNQNTPISICGEVASNPLFIPLLIGLGVNEFSVSTRFIIMCKKAMRSIYFSEASDVASEALELSTAQEIRELLNTRFGNRMGNIFEK